MGEYKGKPFEDVTGLKALMLAQPRPFARNRVRLQTDVRSTHAEPVQFGRQVMRSSPEREFFKGAIDEVFIIAAALTGEEIHLLMKQNALP